MSAEGAYSFMARDPTFTLSGVRDALRSTFYLFVFFIVITSNILLTLPFDVVDITKIILPLLSVSCSLIG
jgi:type III secretory pathway component EscR